MSRSEADEGDEGQSAKTVHLDGWLFERVNEWLWDWRKGEKSEGRTTAYFFAFNVYSGGMTLERSEKGDLLLHERRGGASAIWAADGQRI